MKYLFMGLVFLGVSSAIAQSSPSSIVQIVEVLPDGNEISILNSSPDLEMTSFGASTKNPIFSDCFVRAELGTGAPDYPKSIINSIALDKSGVGQITTLPADRCKSKLFSLNFWNLFPAGSKNGKGWRAEIKLRVPSEKKKGITNVTDILCKKSLDACLAGEVADPVAGGVTKIRFWLID